MSEGVVGPTARSDVDDLLARFEAGSPEDANASVHRSRKLLKQLAGLDPTPPPPTAEELDALTSRLVGETPPRPASAFPQPERGPALPPAVAIPARPALPPEHATLAPKKRGLLSWLTGLVIGLGAS